MLGLARYVTHGGSGPSLNYNFVDGGAFPSAITFSRGSNATQFDSSGNLVYAPNNAIRNNTMVGAVAGTPGTFPTSGWSVFTSLTGLTRTVVGTGTENGIAYIDIQLSGTPSSAGNYFINFENSTQVVATNGQTWTTSLYCKLVAGTLNNISSIRVVTSNRDSGGNSIAGGETAFTPTTASLSSQRISATLTNASASTAFELSYLVLILTGAAIDITLRIGMPQLEIGPVATAVNATSGTAYYGPRLDYDPATLLARGFLVEEQRTNFFTNAAGANGGTIGTGSVSGPDNALCRTFIPTAGAASFPNVTGPTQSFTLSLGQTVDWALSGWFAVGPAGTPTLEPRLVLNLSVNGVSSFTYVELQINTSNWTVRTKVLGAGATEVSAPTITLFKTGLYRVTWVVRYTQDATGRNNVSASIQARDTANSGTYTADGISGVQYSLVQVETGSFVTSTIPTTTTALTRNADVATVTPLGTWFNASQGTFYAEASVPVAAAYSGYVYLLGTFNDGIMFFRQSDSQPVDRVRVSGADQFINGFGATWTTTGVFKNAQAYAANDFAGSVNGGAVATDTSGTVPTVSVLNLGHIGGGATSLNGYIRRISYYPRRLPDATLQQITA